MKKYQVERSLAILYLLGRVTKRQIENYKRDQMIKPIMTKPCEGCPFKLDTLKGWLGKNRALEISETLLDGQPFPCHKTSASKLKLCAGAALILESMNQPNQLMQIAQRLGFYPNALQGADLVFQTFEDFIDHHSQ